MKMSRRVEPEPLGTPAAQVQFGRDLKIMYDSLAQPMPDRLVKLAQALEDALERGEVKIQPLRRLN